MPILNNPHIPANVQQLLSSVGNNHPHKKVADIVHKAKPLSAQDKHHLHNFNRNPVPNLGSHII